MAEFVRQIDLHSFDGEFAEIDFAVLVEVLKDQAGKAVAWNVHDNGLAGVYYNRHATDQDFHDLWVRCRSDERKAIRLECEACARTSDAVATSPLSPTNVTSSGTAGEGNRDSTLRFLGMLLIQS